ncbi:MAG: transcription elongation factor GreA [Treponema sp.]|nr:transcription elongation factor GreA [Treponema sp.]
MAENLIQSVQDMLKEETWTRATISNYTQSNLKELADIVDQARSENCVDDILSICTEHLSHTKDSIIALYLAGIFSLQRGIIDDNSLETLIDIFQKNHKEAIVISLCESILDEDPNNKFALRTLAESYMAEGNDKAWELYTQIVKIDFQEADIAKLLAEHYSDSDKDLSIEYYKKAILRYINLGNYNACKEVWTILTQMIPQEIEFFQLLRRKIAKAFGEIKTTTLMQELYNWYKDNAASNAAYWDTAILILKQNLEVEPKDTWARKEITDCYRGKYASHSHLEDYIKSSNLTQSYRNVFESINDFEKHIAFDKGSFVFHRNWGVGLIRKLENDILTINFGKTAGIHEMSLKMAVSALKPLTKEHIWVLKATMKKEELAKKVKDDKKWALKTIIQSFGNNCDLKRIKAELVPAILTPGEWTSWNSAAKKVLESDAEFGVNPNDINLYTVREHEISAEEKLSNEFKAQKQFFERIEILMKFFNSDFTDNSSDLFSEMYSYFTNYLKSISKVDEQVIAAYLIARKLSGIDKQFLFPVKETFADLYSRLLDNEKLHNPKDYPGPRDVYAELKDSKNTSLKDDFLECIKSLLPDWNTQYIKLFPAVRDIKMINQLLDAGFKADVIKLAKTSFDEFKDYRKTVIFFFEKCQNLEWFKEADISYEKQLITLLGVIDITFREINNHVNTTENKKINKEATDLLFKADTISEYMLSKDEATIQKLYTLIDDISDIDSSLKAKVRSKILEKHADFKFRVSEEKTVQPKGIIVTAKMLEEKKAEADRIVSIEIPQNAKEIAEAREKGDLKENAEYKSAKEKQHMLNLSLSKLQEELNRATVFDPTTSTTAIVSFATVVTLHNKLENKDEKYTILGPWESDPDNNIISYMSPFGNAIMDKKVGEEVSFSINEHDYVYVVQAIEKAKI